MSENQSRTNSTRSCSMRSRTCLRDSSLDVALFCVSTCAMNSSLNAKKPQARATRPRLRCLDDGGSLYVKDVRVLVTGGAGVIGSPLLKNLLPAGGGRA